MLTVYGQIPLPAFNWVKASQTEVRNTPWQHGSLVNPGSSALLQGEMLTVVILEVPQSPERNGKLLHQGWLAGLWILPLTWFRTNNSFRPSGIATTFIILFSQLHVHIVFDGNRVFQAQMKLWGVSEEKWAETRETD